MNNYKKQVLTNQVYEEYLRLKRKERIIEVTTNWICGLFILGSMAFIVLKFFGALLS